MPRMIAIDLGSYSVKVTALQRTSRRVLVEEELEERVGAEGTVPPLSERLAALDAVLEQRPKWRESSMFAVAWPAGQATLHRLNLPFSDPAQVEKTLPFAVEAEVPFDLDDMVLGWRGEEVDGETRTLVYLVRRDALGEMLEELGRRKADPRHVFVDADLLGFYARDPHPAAVVDVGHGYTLVSVAQGGVVRFSRAVNVGGRDFTRALQKGLDCSWEQAERVKHGQAPPDDPDEERTDPGADVFWETLPPQARKLLEEAVAQFLAEVRSTLIAAEDLLGLEIEQVRVGGGAARLPALGPWLAETLGVPVNELADPQGQPVPGSQVVARALAGRLAGQAKGNEIDLRVGDLAYRGGIDVIRLGVTYGAPLLAFLVLASLVNFAWQYRSLSSELNDVGEELRSVVMETFPDTPESELVERTRAVAHMAKQTGDATELARQLEAGGAEDPPVLENLRVLTNAFPPHPQTRVEVRRLTYTPESLEVQAETDSARDAATAQDHIRSEPRFARATTSGEQARRGVVTFTVNIPFEDEEEES